MVTFRKALMDSLPVMVAYIFLGIGYGMLMEQHGHSLLLTTSISLFTFAGSAQFALIGFLSAGITPYAIFFLILIINARHIFYGISMNQEYKTMGKWKWYLYLSLTDETFTILKTNDHQEGIDRKKYLLFLSSLNQFYWVLGSVLGHLLGSLIPFEIKGLEFILSALFLSAFVLQIKKKNNRVAGAIGMVVSIVCLWLFQENFVAFAMIGIVSLLLLNEFLAKKKVSTK